MPSRGREARLERLGRVVAAESEAVAPLLVEREDGVLDLVAPLELLGGVVLALVVQRDELQHAVPPDELQPRPSLRPIQSRALRELVVSSPTSEEGKRAAPPVAARASSHLGDEPAAGEVVNARACYEQEANPERMIWFLAPYWYVGKREEKGLGQGWVQVRSLASVPEQIHATWSIWNSAEKRWVEAPELRSVRLGRHGLVARGRVGPLAVRRPGLACVGVA